MAHPICCVCETSSLGTKIDFTPLPSFQTLSIGPRTTTALGEEEVVVETVTKTRTRMMASEKILTKRVPMEEVAPPGAITTGIRRIIIIPVQPLLQLGPDPRPRRLCSERRRCPKLVSQLHLRLNQWPRSPSQKRSTWVPQPLSGSRIIIWT